MKTALDFAIFFVRYAAVQLLLEHGALLGEKFEICIEYEDDESFNVDDFYKIVEILMIYGLFLPIDNDFSLYNYFNNKTLLDLLMKYFPSKIDAKKLYENVSYNLGIDGLSIIKYYIGPIQITNEIAENLSCHVRKFKENSIDEHQRVADFFEIDLFEYSKRSIIVGWCYKNIFYHIRSWREVLPQVIISNETIKDFIEYSLSEYEYDIIVHQFLKLFDKGVLVAENEEGYEEMENMRSKIKFLRIKECYDEFADDWIYDLVDKEK